MNEHTDGHHCATLHYAVQTDPAAKIVIEGSEYHIPSDGHLYLLNASRPHYVKNESTTDRIHITFAIHPACFKRIKKAQLERMQKYFRQFNLDAAQYKHIKIED